MVNNDFHEEDGDNYLDDFNDGNGTDIYMTIWAGNDFKVLNMKVNCYDIYLNNQWHMLIKYMKLVYSYW